METRDHVYEPTETPFQPRAESYHAHNLSERRTLQQPLWIGGHGLGGALALLAGARLQL